MTLWYILIWIRYDEVIRIGSICIYSLLNKEREIKERMYIVHPFIRSSGERCIKILIYFLKTLSPVVFIVAPIYRFLFPRILLADPMIIGVEIPTLESYHLNLRFTSFLTPSFLVSRLDFILAPLDTILKTNTQLSVINMLL